MGFTIEQECPQCGAPIELEETDHLLRCPYCNIKNFLFVPDYFRFVLPHKTPDKEIIYAPYLRFKGNVYFCRGKTVSHRIVDITHLGAPLKGLSTSLGIRPQAMKMKFVTSDTVGSFLKFTIKVTDILTRAGKNSPALAFGKLFHRAYIGETLSIIYLPLFVEENRIFDAVTNMPITKLPQDQDIFGQAINNNPLWRPTFISTLCPQCGWNLEGERDSVVLTCRNCNTAWEASEGKFNRIGFSIVPGLEKNTIYLPFWKISARAKGVEINSYADFIRLTNQPRVVGKEGENQDMNFWSPAFKIRPRIFLRLLRQLTVSQKQFQMDETIAKKKLYPVTLPQTEAVQCMKLTLADSSVNKEEILPLLPYVRFNIKDSTLVYLPFKNTGHEMIQQHMRFSINKSALTFGRHL